MKSLPGNVWEKVSVKFLRLGLTKFYCALSIIPVKLVLNKLFL